MRLLLDPAVADKPAGAPVSPVAASPTPAAPPAAPAPATKTESASTPTVAAEGAKPSPWLAVPEPKAEDKREPAQKAEPDKKPEPEKFDLKVPEGAAMDAAALAKFESSMKELGLDAKQAQKILERDLAAQKASHEETLTLLKKQDADGVKALQTAWGTKFAERSETVKRAFDYADPDGSFRKKLGDSYLANNPDLISFVEKFGQLMKEDSIAAGPNAARAGKDNRPLPERSKDAFTEWLKKGK
jgi:hypothetical protein